MGAFLGAQVMLDTAARLGCFDNLEPVTIGIASRVGENFDHVAVFQLCAKGHEAAIDFCAATVLAHLGMDDKGKVQRCGPFGQFLYVTRRGVDVHLVLKQIHLERMHELTGVCFFALALKNFAQPCKLL